MRFRPSAFANDVLTLTRWELVRLFFGQGLRKGALLVFCASDDAPTPPVEER